MIQRIQTVWLLLAIVAIVVCLCLPLAWFEQPGMTPDVQLTNFCTVDGEGSRSFGAGVLLALFLIVALPDAAMAITSFRNRKFQATLCLVGIADMVLWYAFLALQLFTADGGVSVGIGAALPLVAIVFFWLARRGILADEALVRAADRIR